MTRTRIWARLLPVVVMFVGLILGFTGPASAHGVLISSDPADGSTVLKSPVSVSFTFDEPVQNFDPVVAVTGPDGRQYRSGPPQIDGNVVSSALAPGPAGVYTAAYRIVSADGHPVTGQVRFTVTTDGSGSPTTGGSGSPTTGGSGSPITGAVTSAGEVATSANGEPSSSRSIAGADKGTGLSAWLWIGLIIAAIVIAAAAVLLLRRPAKK